MMYDEMGRETYVTDVLCRTCDASINHIHVPRHSLYVRKASSPCSDERQRRERIEWRDLGRQGAGGGLYIIASAWVKLY